MLIIDRFEGDQAVIEFDSVTFDIPRSALPEEAEAGDIISINLEKNKSISRKNRINKLSEELFE